jgi:signal transduction protein with GAF and PtsI domain
MEGVIAVPIWGQEGKKRKLKGVLGVAKKEAYEFSGEEIAELEKVGTQLAAKL